MRRILIIAALLVSACKCTPIGPSPAPAPTPSVAPLGFDAGSVARKYRDACENLKLLGCQEGSAFDCASVLQRADTSHLTLVPVACIVAGKTKDDERACGGFVKCP